MKNDMKIEGKLVYLVPFTEKHLNDPVYLMWLRDYEVIKFINRPEYSAGNIPFEEVKAYVEGMWSSSHDLFFAMHFKETDRFVGTLKIGMINDNNSTADIGIVIGDKGMWGKGLGSDAVSAAVKHCFEALELRKVTAGLMEINPAMAKVFTKLGFKEEGRFRKQDNFEGEYIDHVYLGCFKEEFKEV